MEKEKEAQKFYKPYYKRQEDNNQSQPPPHNSASMNLTEVGMDNFFTFHQQPYFEKNCPQWINSMTLVMNQMLDSKLTEDGDEERKYSNTSTKEQEDETMVLWNSVSLFNAEEERNWEYEDVVEMNVTTRSQGLVKEDSLMLPKIKRIQKNVKKFQNNSSADKIPEFTITSQYPRQKDTFSKPNEEK